MSSNRSDQGHLIGGLDTATSWIERPIRRVSGADRFNPLPHAGTISVFLLIVVVVSGLYITLFFQYGYEASYDSVLRMEGHPIQRTMRALHRYSSAALVVTTVVHAWRIFVAGRFEPRRRRWRWLTGVTTLLILWPAGVSGYLLVWDTRAGVIGEVIANTLSRFGFGTTGFGTAWAVRYFSSAAQLDGSSGSTFMVVVWFIHLGLTAVVGYFAFRHLRRSKLRWLPERRWMLAMGGSMFVVSVVVPLGMLSPVDASQVGATVPLDPFVLFLLPALGGPRSWLWLIGLTMVAGVVGLFPFIRRTSRKSGTATYPVQLPVRVIEPNCTGCDLCVVDCPYEALSTVPRRSADGENPGAATMVAVDGNACTSCGICIGSCAFGALELPGVVAADSATADAVVVDGATVVVACDRHHLSTNDLAALGAPVVLEQVRCAGIVGPDLVRTLTQRGAERIEVVGCATDDCRYGVGNTLAEARIDGDHAPHVARAHRSMVAQHWVAPGELARSVHLRDERKASDSAKVNASRSLVGSSALVLISALAIAAATLTPFQGESADAAVRVVVDQEPDRGLIGLENFAAVVDSIEVTVDGASLGSVDVARWRGDAVALESWSLDPGRHDVLVEVTGGVSSAILFDDTVDLVGNEQLNVIVRSPELTAVADEGRDVFFARENGCSVCHSIEPGEGLIGPSLYGVATRAEDRVAGLDARTYLWQSILLPDEYVVDGYPAGQMLPIYRERLSQEQLDALLAYMLTLTEEQDGGGS